jgi:hypothetical protein
MRTEFGVARSSCSCGECQLKCRFMPGFLIPADLKRMIPPTVDPFAWAERNLLASPGAIVVYKGETFRVPTLVPATKADGSCINLTREGRCAVHAIAPFGCAFFACNVDPPGLSQAGIAATANELHAGGLYAQLWYHLWETGRRQLGPEILRPRMEAAR